MVLNIFTMGDFDKDAKIRQAVYDHPIVSAVSKMECYVVHDFKPASMNF